MTKAEVKEIEDNLAPDGLTGYLFAFLTEFASNDLFDVGNLNDGSAAMMSRVVDTTDDRRQFFLDIWEGCERISDELKKRANHSETNINHIDIANFS